MPNQKQRTILLARWILSLAVCASAIADDTPPANDTSSPAGVSVPESPGARELIDKARDKENQKEWKTAAEFYSEALSKYPGRVVPVSLDADKGIYQYSGIAPIAAERISKWPAEGLAIYRKLYGLKAADLLASATDTASLKNVFDNYFVTDAGKTAGARLVDTYLENGDFQAAAWVGDRLINLHPFLAGDRGMILYRTAVACQWAGHGDRAHALLDQLKQMDPNAVGSIGGKDVPLVDALTTALAVPLPLPTTRPTDADTYPSYGGLGGRGDISPSSAKPGASLNSVLLNEPDFKGLMGQQKTAAEQNDQLARTNFLAMGIMPVVDAGSLFFQDGRCVYAVDADSGAPLPGWLNTYGGERRGQYRINQFGRAHGELLTLSVCPSSVLAIMGQADRGSVLNGNFAMPGAAVSTVKLVCLDRDTGRENWIKTPADLPDSAAVLRTAEYGGTPLIVSAAQAGRAADAGSGNQDSLLVIARGSKENQFDDCYIVCLDLKTGNYRWSTYIGSATRNVDMDGFITEDPSMMALANGRVFVMTNLGTVACLDPADGRMLWLDSYNRDASDNLEAMGMGRRRFGGGFGGNPGLGAPGASTRLWAHNPVFVSGGYVFALPTDTHQLFVYDAGTGEQKKRLPMSAWDNAGVLLGVRDGGVCLTSDKGVFVVDWKNFDDGDPKTATRWSESDITHNDEHSDVCGRGFLTSDSIFVPTKNRLIQMTWKSGKTVSNYPSRGSFTGDQGPGNLLVTAHNVVVAGQTRVDVYTDLNLVKQKYEAAMAAAPNDPQPRVQYAEALFAGGQIDDALTRVDEAINLTGGLQSMRSGKDRSVIFNAMLDFARRADRNAESDKDDDKKKEGIAQANQFFDRAAAAADSPLENATYRLARAAFDQEQKDYAGEVKLCQEVLTSESMRNAALSDDTNAAVAAEAAIDMAMDNDHTVYAPIEAQAAAALADARRGDDPNLLLAVATVYPNSKAAVDARQDAVHRFEAANEPQQAIGVLRRMYTSATDSAGKAQVLVSITNDFLASPDGLGPALDRLCRAAKISPDKKLGQPLRFSDGTSLADATYTDAIAKLRQMQADQDAAKLPDFHLATPTRGLENPFKREAVISNVTAIVHPLTDFNRVDQMLTWSPAGLSIFSSGATTPTFIVPDVNQLPLGAAWVRNNWLVWTATQLYQIGGDGKVAWTFAVDHLPTLLVSAAGEPMVDDTGESTPDDAANNIRLIQVGGQLVRVPGGVVVRGGRGIVRFNGGMVGGGVMPVPPPAPQRNADEEIVNVQPGGPGAEQILVTTTTGRVLALGGRNGQQIWQTRLSDTKVDQLLANAHFTVIRIDDPGGSQIAVYDTPTGRLIGRRRFGPDASQNQLVNVALSEEATLAMTLYAKVVVKDLYDPWRAAPKDLVAQANDAAPYVGMSLPDQLLVKGGRLVCLYDSGSYARGYDLSTNAEPTYPLQTQANTTTVSLRMVGSRVYILTSNRMLQYNLADATDHFSATPEIVEFVPPRTRALMLGKDYAMVLYDPVDRGPAGSPMVALACYRRALIKGTTRERDDADYCPTVHSSVGMTDWLATEGGVCYLTRDGNLHVLRGARQ
jgi:outer membrane protein assembly factor BamB